ncbi:MAG: putative hydrophobic protein (TIGR00271 family) [Acidimicrobiales bacterium]|jgi:uncharacterized hydrophobic protein (TIGR00271 family)
MNDLAMVRVEAWVFRFTVMLTLAVIVAVMGLSADSAAVVIGAMLLAPLMTPVLGLAAAISMALPNKIIESTIRVTVATVWCIIVAYAISLIIPDGALPNEVISRTSPDLRDLVVALAAGVAGSYATVRKDASAALPGVAVAVALVPPLGTVGITLEAGRLDLAAGALLLYGTNLAAIILAGLTVFVVTGFVPPRRLARTTPGILAGTAIAVAVVVAVAVPLIRASVAAARSAQTQQQVDEAVAVWLEGYELDVDDVDINADLQRVSVEISGLIQPPEQTELERLLGPILGDEARASVQWTRTQQATTTTTAAPTTTIETDEERQLRSVEDVVNQWLVESAGDENEYQLESVSLRADVLRVDVVGTGQSPSVDALIDRLTAELGLDLTVRLTWVPRSIVAPASAPTPLEVKQDQMATAVNAFARKNDLTVAAVEFDGKRVVVDVVGPTEPASTELVLKLIEIAEDDVRIDVYFTERRRLATTTTLETTATLETTTVLETTTTN